MDVQLQELIDKIKKDGVGAAEASAAEINARAEKKAAEIIAQAEEKADALIKKAKQEADRLEQASVAAITQAGRNLLISFRDGVTRELSALISAETVKAYNSDLLKTLVPEVVKNWITKNDADSVAVLLSEKDLAELQSGFTSALKAEMAKGIEIKSDANVVNGFRIGAKDGSAYYDFSAEAVADLFASYLNPKVAQIMKDAAGGQA